MTRQWRLPLLVLLGTVLVQAAWILAVPPFRGIDEFDHAYRAAAVAHGEWRPGPVAEHGRGELVTVPADLVKAAHRQCAFLEYTGRDDCTAVDDVGGGMVTVASSASRYHPAFYWVVGKAAEPFDGVASLYAMRIAGALICAVGLALAAWCLMIRRTSPWPMLGLFLALSPVFVYSTIVVAPNGVEMVAGVLMWSALMSIGCADGRRTNTGLMTCGAVAAVVLVTTRSLGPLLAILILAIVLVMRGREVLPTLRRHRVGLSVAAAVTALATAGSLWWILSQSTLAGGEQLDPPPQHAWDVLSIVPPGLLQAIAAFPLRNEMAPPMVYVAYGLVAIVFFLGALRVSRGRTRLALVAVAAASFFVPILLSLASMRSSGLIWQGRYGLPLSAGGFLLAAWAWQKHGVTSRRTSLVLPVAMLLLTLADVLSVGALAVSERHRPTSAGDPGWVRGPVWLVVALGLLGWLVYSQTLRSDKALVDD